MANVLVMQTIGISKILHTIEFKPTDDAMLHIQLEREFHDVACTIERMCKAMSKKYEEMINV